jgi:hypothetical protein
MTKTSAERQAAYRAWRDDGDRRLNAWISSKADFALERLAKRYAVTKRAMLERLIIAEDDRTRTRRRRDLSGMEWNAYFDVRGVTL